LRVSTTSNPDARNWPFSLCESAVKMPVV